jgi:tetratricopeptide (TPR) repeat protein
MERKNNLYLLILLSLFLPIGVSVKAAPDIREGIYQAFISNQMSKWELLMLDYEKKLPAKASLDQRLELASWHYGYIGYCLSQKLSLKAETWLEKADANLDILLKEHPLSAEAHAFKGAMYGFRIALSNFKAVYLGRKSESHINKAMELNPLSFQSWLETANATYYKPGFVGGSKTKALTQYQKAVSIAEKDAGKLKNNWLYLLALTNLARGYEETTQYDKAKAVYEKILRHEPDYLWVKTKLLPELLKKK